MSKLIPAVANTTDSWPTEHLGATATSDMSFAQLDVEVWDGIVEFDEGQELISIIYDCIRDLVRLTKLIRRATYRDRYQIALQKPNLRFTDFFDIHHISQKYPKLGPDDKKWLRTRLGRSNTDRRRYLAYCREHHDELQDSWPEPTNDPGLIIPAEQLHTVQGDDEVQDGRVLPVDPTVQASTRASTLHVQAFREKRRLQDNDDTVSYTTVGDHILLGDVDKDVLALPTLEAIRKGAETFECPLCHELQDIQTESKWRCVTISRGLTLF
jgi:hypothetical protein